MQGFPEHIWRKAIPQSLGKVLRPAAPLRVHLSAGGEQTTNSDGFTGKCTLWGKLLLWKLWLFLIYKMKLYLPLHAIHYQLRDLGKASTLPLISFLKNGDTKPGSGGAHL